VKAFQTGGAREAMAAGDDEGRLVGTVNRHRHDRNAGLQREANETVPAVHFDAVAIAPRPEHLVVTTRKNQHRGALAQRGASVGVVRRNRAEHAQGGSDDRITEHHVVGEGVEWRANAALLGPAEQQREHVAGLGAAGVVADDQHRPLVRNLLPAADLAGVVPRQDPQQGKATGNELRVTLKGLVTETAAEALVERLDERGEKGREPFVRGQERGLVRHCTQGLP